MTCYTINQKFRAVPTHSPMASAPGDRRLKVAEMFGIGLDESYEVTLYDGLRIDVRAGDVVFVAPNETHQFCNTGQETCEFINGAVADRIINEQLDLMRNNQKTAEVAMKAVALQINDEIAKNLKKNKDMKARYDAIRAGKKQP
jgi:hypothetical protein